MALAVLSKGLIGVLIPGVTLMVLALWQRDLRLLKDLRWSLGVPVFAVIAVPWFVLAARRNTEFLHFFFVREHFQRFLTPIEHRSEPWWFFAPILLIGTLPWTAQAARALLVGWRAAGAGRLLWIWTVFVLVFFSCSDAKLIPYILPAIPTLALLCARPDGGDERWELAFGALASAAAALGILAYAHGLLGGASGFALAWTLAPVLVWTSVGLLCAATAGVVALIRRRPRAALAVLCTGWLWTSATVLIGADRAASFYSAKDCAMLLRAQPGGAGPSVPVFSVQSYEQSLPFYLDRPVTLVDYRDELDFGLRAEPDRGIASLGQFAGIWRRIDRGFAIMPLSTRARLAELGLPMRELGRFADLVVVSRR
jgi:4-amino-4-deoxy-L-arabinose transferase-like glycosyltransferase